MALKIAGKAERLLQNKKKHLGRASQNILSGFSAKPSGNAHFYLRTTFILHHGN